MNHNTQNYTYNTTLLNNNKAYFFPYYLWLTHYFCLWQRTLRGRPVDTWEGGGCGFFGNKNFVQQMAKKKSLFLPHM